MYVYPGFPGNNNIPGGGPLVNERNGLPLARLVARDPGGPGDGDEDKWGDFNPGPGVNEQNNGNPPSTDWIRV